MNAGDVLVLAANGFSGGAVLGDMMALRARYRGAAAIIVDGAVRDIAGITESNLGVYHRSGHPMSGIGAVIPWEADVPVDCDGVLIRPGDWILVDQEAAIVVPEARVDKLVEQIEDYSVEDEFCCKLLKLGYSLRQTHPLASEMQPLLARYRKDGSLPARVDEVSVETVR